ncbi:Ig-like domain-containing protein [Alcanivorax sp. JB21]|uniref:Ig-like domain-containing protein n=1 Tax=Alcanivorax limicola TaxID=2874102 RepID=UPI001CBE6EF8|nr:Ig-like domain-containing protein [Alcanivorax limicola]MBZ2188563.1 Ig-like domain-containing protein [Alcanivorax limicola]
MKTKHAKWLQLVMVGLVATSLAACGGSNRPGDPRIDLPDGSGGNNGEDPRDETFCEDPTQLFELDGIVPADGATGVPQNISPVVRFNEPVAADSVNETTLFITANGAPVPVTYTINGRTVTLTPEMNLAANTLHTLTIGPELRAAECVDPLPTKFLAEGEAGDRTFATGGEVDNEQPRVEAINPADGATLVSTSASIIITFNEPVLPATVNDSTVTVTRRDNGQVITGTFDVNAEVATFQPDAPLVMQENYDVAITTNIRDLAGNSLEAPFNSEFRTGGVVVLLNDELISQIPGLGDLLNTIGDTLLGNLELSDGEGGTGSLDNLLIIKLPLVPGIPEGGLDGFDGVQFEDTLIAICDPSTPGENCTLALDIALDPLALQELADAFTGGDPEQIPGLLAEALIGEGGFLGINLDILEPNGLGVLPGPLEDALNMVLGELQGGLDQVPVLNELFANFGVEALVQASLLNGALLDADVGNLLAVNILDLSTGNLIDLSGGLVDALDPVLDPLSEILCAIRLLCSN